MEHVLFSFLSMRGDKKPPHTVVVDIRFLFRSFFAYKTEKSVAVGRPLQFYIKTIFDEKPKRKPE